MRSVSNVYVSHLILYLRYKFHGNIPNDRQDIAQCWGILIWATLYVTM